MTQWDLTNNAELCFDCSPKKHSGTANCAGQKKDAGARVLWAMMLESRREKHLCLPTCKGLVYAFNCTDFICTSIVSMLVQAGKMAIHVKATHTQCFYWPTLVIFYGEFLQVCDDPLYIYFFDDFWLRCRCAIVSSALWISAWVNSSIPAILFFCVFARRSKMIALTMKSRRAYAQISVTHLREESRTQIDILRTCHQCHQCHKIQCCSRFFRSQSFQRLRGEKVSKAEVPRL